MTNLIQSPDLRVRRSDSDLDSENDTSVILNKSLSLIFFGFLICTMMGLAIKPLSLQPELILDHTMKGHIANNDPGITDTLIAPQSHTFSVRQNSHND